jgi:HAD superfamily hydrolase (TIGR01509 family)
MPYSALLLDLDGTLVDTISLYGKAVLQSLKEIGVEATEKDFYDWYIKPLHLSQILSLYKLDESHVPALRLRRDELYEELLRTETRWLPGGKETLQALHGKIPMAVITGSWMSYVDAIDECLGVKKYIDVCITADDIHKFMKPHPHGLLLACDRLGVEPKDCLYAGDQIFDIEAAHAAGMKCALVKSAYTPAGAEKHADWVLQDAGGIAGLIS